MKRTQRKAARKRKKVIRSWKLARGLLEGWRKKLTNVRVELKRPRVIDVAAVDFLRDEAPEGESKPTQQFRGRLIFFTQADVTIPSVVPREPSW